LGLTTDDNDGILVGTLEETMRIDQIKDVNDYSSAVADYLCDEYGDMTKALQIDDTQRNVVGSIINYCYDHGDSVSNAGNYLIEFIRKTSHE
jgi:hypothetical protein